MRQWRDQIKREVLVNLPDAAWIDLDEARNEVAVGLVDGSGRAEVESALARLGVATDGVRIEITGRTVLNESVRDRVRPVAGGLAQAVTFNGQTQQYPWCTYAFNAQHNGVDVILTASHCTQTVFLQDSGPTVFYQKLPIEADRVGSEWLDPPAVGASCVTPDGYRQHCHRFSDAVMIAYDPGVSFDLGLIARTTSRSLTWGQAGSWTIDPSNPRFRIVAVQDYPVMGQRVEKVGWHTGWTSGIVRHTCVDLTNLAHYWVDCQYQADYWSDDGDSGAPVFSWPGSGNDITLVGIHWGIGEHTDFSPWGGIIQDFGGTWYVVPEPLSNSIINHDGYFYTNTPAGGNPPYVSSYWEWCGIDCDGGGDLTSPASRGGVVPNAIAHGWQFLSADWTVYWTEGQRWLRATVTDSHNQQAVATYWVP